MKKCLFLAMAICLSAPAYGADEKIDPETYICAELVATSVDGQPPLFEGLQLDGYFAGKNGQKVADPDSMQAMLIEVSDSCASKPAEKALSHWAAARKNQPLPDDGVWRADKLTCADYQADPDNASGFIIWLDGYQRAKNGTKTSVFESQETLDNFLEACKASPTRLVVDVMAEKAK